MPRGKLAIFKITIFAARSRAPLAYMRHSLIKYVMWAEFT
jgi:hypothetical protein